MEVGSHRLLLAVLVASFALLFAIPCDGTSQPHHAPVQHHQQQEEHSGGGFKLPAPVAAALLHYATSRVTPQLTSSEAGLAARALMSRRAPCNLLVFGLGRDTALWAALNHGHGGRTVFLEEDAAWIAAVRAAHPWLSPLEVYHVAYETKLADAAALLALRDDPACVGEPDLNAAAAAGCRLAPWGLPAAFYEVEWDVILVDAPTGYAHWTPGRMGAIYAAGMAARARRRPGETTDVLVHDVDRPVEDRFSRAFLCAAYEVEQVGKLRHFVLPSHRSSGDGDDAVPPFCPPLPLHRN